MTKNSFGFEKSLNVMKNHTWNAFWTLAQYCAEYHLPFDLMIGVNQNAGIANFAEQLIKYVKAISNG